jgi:hypothetical protein
VTFLDPCPVAVFGISGVEPWGPATRHVVDWGCVSRNSVSFSVHFVSHSIINGSTSYRHKILSSSVHSQTLRQRPASLTLTVGSRNPPISNRLKLLFLRRVLNNEGSWVREGVAKPCVISVNRPSNSIQGRLIALEYDRGPNYKTWLYFAPPPPHAHPHPSGSIPR